MMYTLIPRVEKKRANTNVQIEHELWKERGPNFTAGAVGTLRLVSLLGTKSTAQQPHKVAPSAAATS